MNVACSPDQCFSSSESPSNTIHSAPKRVMKRQKENQNMTLGSKEGCTSSMVFYGQLFCRPGKN